MIIAGLLGMALLTAPSAPPHATALPSDPLGGGWLLLSGGAEGRDGRRARGLLWSGWAASTVGAPAEGVGQGPYASGTGLGRLTSGTLLDATLHTTYGSAHSIRLLLLGALGV